MEIFFFMETINMWRNKMRKTTQAKRGKALVIVYQQAEVM